jgi:hypothetical protein
MSQLYYRLINPYQYHKSSIFYYHYLPDELEPTGALNFSRVVPLFRLKSVLRKVANALFLIRLLKFQRRKRLETIFVADESLPVEVWWKIISFAI